MMNERYGRLTVMTSPTNGRCKAICDCGMIKEYNAANIKYGKTKSCGCYASELSSDRYKKLNFKTGLSNHPLNRVWSSMLARCYSPSSISFINYGGIGISVCDLWRDNFINFYQWSLANGFQEGLQIDRIDNNKNYTPENCRFVTRSVNCRNRRSSRFIELNGERKTLAEWCEEYSVTHTMVIHRINRGWPIEKTLFTPSKRK